MVHCARGCIVLRRYRTRRAAAMLIQAAERRRNARACLREARAVRLAHCAQRLVRGFLGRRHLPHRRSA
jgi:hypothetical protein